MRKAILWAVLGLVLVTVNVLIVGKESLLASGDTLVLDLRPRDPRSLMQGDYMSLRYRIGDAVASTAHGLAADGLAVVKVDGNGVASFVRLHDGTTPLAADERLLRFRKRAGQVRIGGNAFFFQEGLAEVYQPARYGELRVDRSGDAVLVGLRDESLHPLGTPPAR
jgi:uncharacterized membrane-anchored protein